MKLVMKAVYVFFSIAVWLGLVGCEDWFAKELPPHQLVGENAITNESTAKVALNGVYSYLDEASLNSQLIIDNEYRLGLFSKGNREDFEEYLLRGKLPVEDANVLGPWEAAYKIINAANNFIYYVEQVPEDKFEANRKTEMLAEAKFLRAFAHSMMLRKYGFFFDFDSKYGALMRMEPATLSNNSMPRSTVAESYRLIFEDYDYAIQYGPQFYSVFRASSSAAKAFKADLLMSRGTEGDYAEAARLADEVLSDSVSFAMESDYVSVFTNGYSSKELMFSRSVDKAPEEQDNTNSIYQLFCKGIYQPSGSFDEYFGTDDLRYGQTLDSVQAGSGSAKTQIWKKHYQQSRDCPMYFMRLAQMVLVKAEAMLYTGAAMEDIVPVLNILRERSGNTLFEVGDFDSREDLQEEIFCEYLRELGMENGNLFYVAVRMKMDGQRKIQLMNPNYDSDNLLVFPIPRQEMENNFEIEQRP